MSDEGEKRGSVREKGKRRRRLKDDRLKDFPLPPLEPETRDVRFTGSEKRRAGERERETDRMGEILVAT